MGTTYFKRFRMEIDLQRCLPPEPVLPADYHWLPWHPSLLERHARTKHGSFCDEIDSRVFPALSELSGCRQLMSEIARRPTFLPQTTWLIAHHDPRTGRIDDCATIQGMLQPGGWGSIQNVGVIPSQRGLGLGRAVVLKSLAGFRLARVTRVYLEVTAKNSKAVQLYRSIGFRLAKTSYKPVDLPEPPVAQSPVSEPQRSEPQVPELAGV